ncbi:MAG: hypothetical protein Q3962_08315 [Corynebacterium sp.]|nr:hypothetical protein [Corynebacterium sp.]
MNAAFTKSLKSVTPVVLVLWIVTMIMSYADRGSERLLSVTIYDVIAWVVLVVAYAIYYQRKSHS